MSDNDLREFMRSYHPGAKPPGETRSPQPWKKAAIILAVVLVAGFASWLVVWFHTRDRSAPEQARNTATAQVRHLGPLVGYAYTWSPDGKAIAYFAPSAEDNNPTLWRISPTGKSRHRIPVDMSLPYRLGGDASRARIGISWAPPGTQIACGPALPLSGRAWTVDLDSRLTWDLGVRYAAPPNWSPDGSELAFVRRGVDREKRKVSLALHLVSADGDREQEIGRIYFWPLQRMRLQGPVWSPDGQRIVVPWDRAPVTGSPAVARGPIMDAWLVERDGSDPHPLATDWDYRFANKSRPRVHCEYTQQCWSPDGEYVAVSAFEETNRWHALGLFQLSVATGRAEPMITESIRPDSLRRDAAPRYPTWSPDGKRVAFVAESRLYVLEVREARCLPIDTGGRVLNAPPLWSPDSKRILYAAPSNTEKVAELCAARLENRD